MLITFFDLRGMIHTEFVLLGQTVNKDFYKRVLDQLLKRMHATGFARVQGLVPVAR